MSLVYFRLLRFLKIFVVVALTIPGTQTGWAQNSNKAARLYIKARKHKEDLNKRIEILDKALRADSTHERALRTRAVAHRLLGNFDLALSDYDRLIALSQDQSRYLFDRAETLMEMGNDSIALLNYQTAIALAPDDYYPYVLYARALRQLGKLPKALQVYGQAIERQPALKWLHHEKAALMKEYSASRE